MKLYLLIRTAEQHIGRYTPRGQSIALLLWLLRRLAVRDIAVYGVYSSRAGAIEALQTDRNGSWEIVECTLDVPNELLTRRQ